MSFKDSKVVIVGAGNVGATTAYSILNQGICEEIVLIDVNKHKAFAEALDMQHSIYFMNRNMKIKAGDYSEWQSMAIQKWFHGQAQQSAEKILRMFFLTTPTERKT